METTKRQKTLAIVEGAVMVALAVILDMLPLWKMPEGGSVTLAVVPVIYYSYRRGTLMGCAAGLVWACTQFFTGQWYMPPANTFGAAVLCLLLDYFIPFTVVGTAPLFAKLLGKFRFAGYAAGAAAVCLLRYVSHIFSGVLLWGSYAGDMNVWWYSVTYNGAFMLPITVLAAVVIVALCATVDPKTLRPYRRGNN